MCQWRFCWKHDSVIKWTSNEAACRSRGVVGVTDRKEVEERRRKIIQANEKKFQMAQEWRQIDQTHMSERTDADFVMNEVPFMNNSE